MIYNLGIMYSANQILNSKSLMVIFTYAPAGLGHLRVTEALYSGLPKNIAPVLLGSQDQSVSYFHRLTSISYFGKKIMDFFQNGIPEDIFTILYKIWLKNHTQILYKQLITLIDQRLEVTDKLLIIATHFGLAHQIAAIKDKFFEDKKVKITLIVQVTDDSPQHIWYVDGADLIFVPSQKTKQELEKYGKNNHLAPVKFEVSPYPVSISFVQKLSEDRWQNKKLQADININLPILIAVPVSGAAVQLNFFDHLSDYLFKISDRFKLEIISLQADFTQDFLNKMNLKKNVNLTTSFHKREIVSFYEDLYRKKNILLEITKPSEQAFKAMLDPNQAGGAILLFTFPVGRQENDNLDFLEKYQLIPNSKETNLFWKMAKKNQDIPVSVLKLTTRWRGLILPNRSIKVAQFISWCHKQGVFQQMLKCRVIKNNEIGSQGVEKFWKKIIELY